MNKNKKIFIIVAIVILLLLVGLICYFVLNKEEKGSTAVGEIDSTINVDDYDIDWDSYTSHEVSSDENGVNITESGIYTLTGEINGQVVVNTSGNVKLILDNVSIKSSNGPCILVKEASNVVISTTSGSTNVLEDSTNYSGFEEEDATIYSHDDLIFEGSGTLKITSNYQDAIASSDDLSFTSGIYVINSSDDAIRGKDSVHITGGDFTIVSFSDGIKSTNDTESDKGNILIEDGTFNIETSFDGIQAYNKVVINNGTFTIKTGGGNTVTTTKSNFGRFENNTSSTSDESNKGIKAGSNIVINGGTLDINSLDDGIHSNGSIQVNSGNITISSGDDGIHADGMVNIKGGTLNIIAQEGIEATFVKIEDGKITIGASDDGINAGNKSSDYSVKIEITGGDITINMGQGDTDGIDSNGDLLISGGTINITGQSPFDYDGTVSFTGGTLIVNGQETKTITNQQMGGGMGGHGNMGQGNMGDPSQGMQDRPQGGRGGRR